MTALATLLAATVMTNVAHRGLWVEAHVPQNTVEAIKAAYDAGAKVVETDFNETACGEMICLHDKKALLSMVKRFDKEVRDITPEDRKTINLGERAGRPRPYRIPTLDEVLAVVPKDCVLQSEIKLYGPGYADKFDAAVKRAGLTERNITVSSFDLAALKDFHAKYPKYETIYLLNMRPQFDASLMVSRCRSAGVGVVCPSCAGCMKVGFKPSEADKVRKAGIEFRVFGVNSPELLKYAMSLGATGFTCNTFLQAYEWAEEIPGVRLWPERRGEAEPGEAKPLALVGPDEETQAVMSDITNPERIRAECFSKCVPGDCAKYAAVVFCGDCSGVKGCGAVPAVVKTLKLEGVSAKRFEFYRAGKPLAEADERGESILTDAGKVILEMTENQRRQILALKGLDRSLPKGEYATVPLGRKGALPAYPAALPVKPVFRAAPPERGEGLVLKDGDRQAVVVAPREFQRLAKELAWHLEKMCGSRFRVMREAEATEKAPVVEFRHTGGALGRSEIRREGNRLIVGGESSGVSFALTYVLESLGCRYLWPGELGKVVPRRKRIVLPDIALDYVPELKIRIVRDVVPKMTRELERLGIDAAAFQSRWRSLERDDPGNRDFMAWHGVNDARNVGGGYSWGHYFGDYWRRFGGEHPDWFALQANGSREQVLGDRAERPALCLSNAGLADQAARDILADFAANPQSIVHSICLPDGGYMGQCMCERCRALDPVNAPAVPNHTGSPLWRTFPYVSLTDRVLTFNNRIAERVVAKMPDRKLSCYVYSYYEQPPVAVRPHPALVLLSVAGNYSKPDRGAVQRNVAAWGVFGNEIVWRPNALIHWRVNLPKNFARPFFEDIEALKANHVIGTDISGFGRQWANKGFVYYMVARAHRNPDHLCYDAVAADYFRAGFGTAADDVAAYFAELERLGDDCAAKGMSANGYVEAFDVGRLSSCLARARRAAAGDETVLRRIAFLERGLVFAEWEKKLVAAWKGGDEAGLRKVQAAYRDFIRDNAFENALAVHPGWFGNAVESPNMRGMPEQGSMR